jgi:hypothetical protein
MFYLIAHKVRGELAFDVAIKMPMSIGGHTENWWLIPTSGHRAYPYRYWALEDLLDTSDINNYGYHDCIGMLDITIPDSWPDHYQQQQAQAQVTVTKSKATSTATIEDLMI